MALTGPLASTNSMASGAATVALTAEGTKLQLSLSVVGMIPTAAHFHDVRLTL